MEGGAKRIQVTTAWDIDTLNASSAFEVNIPGTDHIVILQETLLSSLVCDWVDQDGAAVTSVTLPAGRYEMNAKSFSCDNPVLLIIA